MFSSVHEISIGVITAWSGGLGNIPPGWHLCDGTNGTPDLREKFIVGAGVAFAVGDEGGTLTHTHDFSGDGHHHTLQSGGEVSSGILFLPETSRSEAAGTTGAANTRPPYYALAYIQYLGI